jgi:FkbM family methyltransferase
MRTLGLSLLCAATILALRPASAGEILTTGKSRYSQHNEELIIRDFFGDKRGGFFLDVGCAFPRNGSTTYYLEEHLGWKGIGVDALERYAAAWKKLRPNSEFVVSAATDRSGEVVTFYEGSLPTVSSLTKEQAELFSPEVKAIEVPTITLTKLLEDRGITAIDLLSMDIEGSEPAALAGFDVERFAPKLVVIEVIPEEEHRKKIASYFESHGYERLAKYDEHDLINWYFAPKHR